MHTTKMKGNGADSEYSPVPQGFQSDDDDTGKNNQNGDIDSLKNGSLKKIEAEANLEKGKGASPDEVVPMTPLRKVCFVLSILQCGLFIVAFGYLIPCQIPRYYDNSIQTWNYQLKDYDINTNIELATVDKKQSLIVFGYQSPTNSTSYGLRAVDALSGIVKWEVTPSTLPGSPVAIVCNSQFKLNPEEPPSCLVTDSFGKLLSLNVQAEPVSPRTRLDWVMHIHGGSSKNGSAPISVAAPRSISPPIVLNDCDSDGVNDVVVAGLTSENQALLYVVSGADGTISNTVNLSSCANLPSLLAWEDNKELKVVVSCADKNGLVNVWAVPNRELCLNSTNNNLENLDVDQIHNLEEGDSLSRAITVRNRDDANNYLILVSKKGHIVRSTTNGKSWDVSLPADTTFKDIAGGSFFNASMESLAVLYANSDGSSMILLLDLETGLQQRNISYDESRSTFLYTAISSVDEPDTLLIKNIQGEFNDTDASATAVEEVVALQCKENASFVSVWKAPAAVKCSGLSCSDVVNNRSSVVIGDLNSSGKELAIVTYHISVLVEGSSAAVGTQIELNRLYDALPSKCKTCGC